MDKNDEQCYNVNSNRQTFSEDTDMDRIFLNDRWEQLSLNGGIPHFGYYHRYRNPDGSINPEFYSDAISGLVLDLKEKKENALNFFYSAIDHDINHGITLCVVPSHTSGKSNTSGIAVLAHRLASDRRIDKVDFLLRDKTIDKLATGGERDVSVQRESIVTNPDTSISGDVVLLVDDVTTSGNSLKACRDILVEAGAKRVAMFALAKSI